jgi:hypothetical protein
LPALSIDKPDIELKDASDKGPPSPEHLYKVGPEKKQQFQKELLFF